MKPLRLMKLTLLENLRPFPKPFVLWETHEQFVCVDPLRPSQQFFCYVGAGFPGLNQY